jgi:GT2 family glycosyltransferase
MSRNGIDQAAGIDVAIPCYNYGRFLRSCVASVLSQKIPNLRILIIDNASTDDSVEIARQLAADDRRVEVAAHRQNLGPHASFNEAIDWASSDYFMLLCADDLLAPGALGRAVSIMEKHRDVGFAYGRVYYWRSSLPQPVLDPELLAREWQILVGKDVLLRFCRDGVNHIPGPSAAVVRTAVQKLAGYYRPELPHTDDFEMWMRLTRLGAVAKTDGYQAILRLHESARKSLACQSYTCERPPALPWEDEAAFSSFFAHEDCSLPEAAHLHRLAERSLGDRAYWAAVAHLLRGQPGASRDLFNFALRRRPSRALLPPVSYLFRREDAASRIVSVASELLRRPRAGARSAGMHGSGSSGTSPARHRRPSRDAAIHPNTGPLGRGGGGDQ